MTTQTTDIRANIDALIQHIEHAFATGKATDIADCYSDAGMLLPPGLDFIKGKEEIRAFWQEAIDIGIKQLKLDVITIEQHGDTAIEMSRYTMLGESDHVIDRGKGIVIWKHEQGTWKLFRDIWTTSLPQYPAN